MDTNLGKVVLVKDLYPGVSDYFPDIYSVPEPPSQISNSSFPYHFVEFKDKLYFSAHGGKAGDELHVSDGTVEGTELMVDLVPGEDSFGYVYGSSPRDFVEFKDKLYFSATDDEHGTELFVTDGTAEEIQVVVDLYPGEDTYGNVYGSSPRDFVEFKDKLFFVATNDEHGTELFVTDGTAEGTQLVTDLRSGEDTYGNVYGSYPRDFVEFKDKLYFSATDDELGTEVFVTDGTAEGTELLVDIYPGEDKYGNVNSSYPRGFVEFKDKLYFTANNNTSEHAREIYVSDGTAEGTKLLVDVDIYPEGDKYGNVYGSSSSNFVEFNEKLYFTATDDEHGTELFVTDGTAEGTELLVDIYPGEDKYGNVNSSQPGIFGEFNDKLYFTATDDKHGTELFVTDGTAEGTELVADINQGEDSFGYSYSSDPRHFVEANGKLYFTADDGETGIELYVSDGTSEGTQLVADINPGLSNYSLSNDSFPSDLTVFGDELFFSADNGETGRELFKLTFDGSDESAPIQLNGSDGSDDLLGGDCAESIQALSGQDTVDGGKGNDTIDGGDGDDHLTGNAGNDSLLGGNGNDSLSGDGGNDHLNGGNGSDILNAGTGSDRLTGGEDNDRLDGGIDNDILDGGNGDDTFVLRTGDGSNTIVDFNLGGLNGIGGDQLGLADGLQFTDLSFADNTILAGEEVLATLEGVNAEKLNATDFSVI